MRVGLLAAKTSKTKTRTSARTIGRAILSGTTLTSEGGIPVEVLFVKAFPTN